MVERLIIFLVRKRLGLKKYENFRFVNQKSIHDYYFFGETILMKYEASNNLFRRAGVSLNWLLDDECKVEKLA